MIILCANLTCACNNVHSLHKYTQLFTQPLRMPTPMYYIWASCNSLYTVHKVHKASFLIPTHVDLCFSVIGKCLIVLLVHVCTWPWNHIATGIFNTGMHVHHNLMYTLPVSTLHRSFEKNLIPVRCEWYVFYVYVYLLHFRVISFSLH